ncbi:hypothetical protein M408DRAFT_295230 [Serendipita vermifera MAFF 305830]|uniref:C2H2-type domain-containing protein n=1 Tax=Serendipita vermifera MAFF 305830 TaxID=933852 RepID=A0A0C2XMN0_SERVB|nr:hypothetical protein M408DRAFT_295230 [Serendipita vermifera MAFF 305830]
MQDPNSPPLRPSSTFNPDSNLNKHAPTNSIGNTSRNHKKNDLAAGHFNPTQLTTDATNGKPFDQAQGFSVDTNVSPAHNRIAYDSVKWMDPNQIPPLHYHPDNSVDGYNDPVSRMPVNPGEPCQQNPTVAPSGSRPSLEPVHYRSYSDSLQGLSPVTAPFDVSTPRDTHILSPKTSIEYFPPGMMGHLGEILPNSSHIEEKGRDEEWKGCDEGLQLHDTQRSYGSDRGQPRETRGYHNEEHIYDPAQHDDHPLFSTWVDPPAFPQGPSSALAEENPAGSQDQEGIYKPEDPFERHATNLVLSPVVDTGANSITSYSADPPVVPHPPFTLNLNLLERVLKCLPCHLKGCLGKLRPNERQPVLEIIVGTLSINEEMINGRDDPQLIDLLAIRCEQKLYSLQTTGPRGGVTGANCAFGNCTQAINPHNLGRNLMHHLVYTHLGVKPFLCGFNGCNSAFGLLDDRNRHEKNQHEFVYGSQS